jgi:hypothetical protein
LGDRLRYTFHFRVYDIHDISFYRALRELVFSNLNIISKKKKRITLSKKNSKGHRFINHNETLIYLKNKYKDWEILELDSEFTSIKEELVILANTGNH